MLSSPYDKEKFTLEMVPWLCFVGRNCTRTGSYHFTFFGYEKLRSGFRAVSAKESSWK